LVTRFAGFNIIKQIFNLANVQLVKPTNKGKDLEECLGGNFIFLLLSPAQPL